ncbi:MAG: MMPL family transporter [Deltaproteobacteria bacterium]|nr:MMPL family transporter [Deltaproteobacteria bacterium]MBW2363186.1 MMPL family transporter [Deltaproteobacteria bacterium]
MQRISSWALHRPGFALTGLLLLTAAIGSGILRLETDLGYRAFLGSRHSAVSTFDAFLERFGGGLPMRVVWSCEETSRCDSVFEPAALEMARRVEEQLSPSPAVSGVTSPASAVVFDASPQGVVPRRFFEDAALAADRARLAELAGADAMWVGSIVSEDGRVGSIAIDLVSSESEVATSAYSALDAALAPFEADGWVFHRVGGPVEFVVAGGELDDAMARIVPAMVVLVVLALVVLFRSLLAAALALATTGVAVLWAHGALGWIGWAQNSLTQTLAPLVLVIGVCDGIHLIARYVAHCETGHATDLAGRRAQLERAIADVVRPCWMTSVTTAAGFVSFTSADLESFEQYGVIAALGVMAAFGLTFTLLPVLLLPLRIEWVRITHASDSWRRGLDALVGFASGHRRAILAATAVILVICGYGMTRLRVHSSFDELYGADSRVVRWSHFVAEHLRKPDSLEIALHLPPGSDLASDSVRESIRRSGEALLEIADLERVRSLLDHPLGARAIPAEPEALDASLERWVSADRRHVRLSFEVDKLPQIAMREVVSEARRRLAAELPAGWTATLTGPFLVVHDMVDSIRAAQMRSFSGAALAVALLLAFYLRSVGWALLAMVPTLLPVVSTLGTMGLLGVPLDVGTAMVAAVVLGIAVDDVVHLLDRFRERRRAGDGHEAAMHAAVRHVGQAVVSTSLALSLGFGALALSPWASIAHFGLISAIAILGALVVDLLVLPALVGELAARRSQRVR